MWRNRRGYATLTRHYPSITPQYTHLIQRLQRVTDVLPDSQKNQLTLTEKIFFSHLDPSSLSAQALIRGESFVKLKPDRVAMQGAEEKRERTESSRLSSFKSSQLTKSHCW